MTELEILKTMREILFQKGLFVKQKEMAAKIGVPPSSLSSALHGNKNALTRNFLFRINAAYDNIFNPEWISTGEGPVLAADAVKPVQIDASVHQHSADRGGMVVEGGIDDAVISLQIQNRMLKAENEQLRRDVARLEEEKAKLEKRNDELIAGLLGRNN